MDGDDDTFDVFDLGCRFANAVSAIAAFMAFNSTDTINVHFLACAYNMFVFTYEALYTQRNTNFSCVTSLLGTFTIFSNPVPVAVHTFNFACNAVRNIEENFDEVRQSHTSM